jgi:multiple sugar transport system permease protein
MGAEGDKLIPVARAFEGENPGVKVRIQTIPWGEAHAKLITAYVGGHTPDIAQLGTTWTAEFEAMNALMPLNRYLPGGKPDPAGDRKPVPQALVARNYFPGAWKTVNFNGTIYGVPWYVETRCLFYRTDLLEKAGLSRPPRTWQELEKWGEKLSAPPARYGILLPERDEQAILPFFGQAGGNVFDEKGVPQATSEPFERALTFYVRLFDKGIAPRGTMKDVNVVQTFAEENPPFAMFVSGPWMLTQIEEKAPGLKGKWGVAPLPEDRAASSYMGGCNLVLFKGSKNPDLAWSFMQYLATRESQVAWFKSTGDLPSRPDAWNDPALADEPSLQAFRTQLESAEPPPGLPEWEQMADVIARRMEQAVLKQKSVTDALGEMNQDITAMLRRRTEPQSAWYKTAVLGGAGIVILAGFILYFRRALKEEGSDERPNTKKAAGPGIWTFIFLFPALSILAVFLFLPVIASFLMSLTNYDLYSLASWPEMRVVGLANYGKILADPRFWKSVCNTFAFVIVGGPITIITALAAALTIEKMTRMRAMYLLGFFLPVVTTLVAVAIVWKWIYHPRFGLLNAFLMMFSMSPRDWLSNPQTALPALIGMAVWKNFGYTMIILLSGLQAIPKSYYEAAELDGAGLISRFREITIPLLKPTLFLVTILTTIGYLQFFAEPYVMTQGGPVDSTLSVVLYLYQKGFKFYLMGEAAATSFILFFLIFAISIGQILLGRKSEGQA